jgi:hypothetical protein
LKDDRARRLAEKILHRAGKGIWGHPRIVHIRRPGVCDE